MKEGRENESEEEKDVIGWTHERRRKLDENSRTYRSRHRRQGGARGDAKNGVIVISKFKPPSGLECNLDHEVDIQ